jgi:hypothetical protein
MTKLKAGILGALIIAGSATPLVIHYQAQLTLRERDAALQRQNDQLAQLTAENGRLSNLVAQANSSKVPDQSRELRRLRGEVGVLKNQLAAAMKEQEKDKHASQAKAGVDPEEQQQQIAIANLNYTKGWMLAFMAYANQNQGQFPTNFDQAISFLPNEAQSQTNLAPDQFEIVYRGSLNEISNPATTIVIREKEAWQTLDGGWVRGYSFADGHSEIHKAADGNFQAWEQQHMIAPPAVNDPGK